MTLERVAVALILVLGALCKAYVVWALAVVAISNISAWDLGSHTTGNCEEASWALMVGILVGILVTVFFDMPMIAIELFSVATARWDGEGFKDVEILGMEVQGGTERTEEPLNGEGLRERKRSVSSPPQ